MVSNSGMSLDCTNEAIRIRLALQFFAGYNPAQGSELVSQAQNP